MARFVRTQEIEHPIGASGRFVLRVTSSDVELRSVEGETARVRVQFELTADTEADADALFERVRLDVRSGTESLEVAEPKHSDSGFGSIARLLGIGGARVEASVIGEIPANAELTFVGVSADLAATGFGGEQEYRTVSGDLVLSEIGGSVRVRGVSSDVSLRCDDAVRLEMNTVSGDISAIGPRFDELRIVTVSGDIEFEGGLGAGRQHRIETVSGDLTLGVHGGLELEVRGLSTDVDVSLPHRSEGSRDRRRYIVGDGGANLLFSSMSGDVNAHAPRRLASLAPLAPLAPQPTLPPLAPLPAVPPLPPRRPAPLSGDEQLAVLRALEAGEITIEEAGERLAGRATDA